MKKRGVVALLAAGVGLAGCGRGQLLSNGDFERELEAWNHNEGPPGSATATPVAASVGRFGLRLIDRDDRASVTLRSDPVDALPGDAFRIRFQARVVEGYGVNLFVRFLALQGEELDPSEGSNLRREVPEGASNWQTYELEALAPPDTAIIELMLRCNSRAVVTADFDEIELVRIN